MPETLTRWNWIHSVSGVWGHRHVQQLFKTEQARMLQLNTALFVATLASLMVAASARISRNE
eukprot:2991499-Amphidinium_carterae.1